MHTVFSPTAAPLVALVGFKNSGKSTAAGALQEIGYAAVSFADALKDALAALFCWPRDLLEGITPDSRAWRETVDSWWAEKLGIAEFTPRFAMTHVGTEIMRRQFHADLWTLNVERRLALRTGARRVVLVDARFPNEIAMARRHGGMVMRIRRGPEPSWFDTALAANRGDTAAAAELTARGVHHSEWAWIGTPVDCTVENGGDLAGFRAAVRTAAQQYRPAAEMQPAK